MWYGGFIACTNCATSQGKDRVNGWHYANSSDGLHWKKPHLGIFDLATIPECSAAAKAAGKDNNILMSGDGLGIYKDTAEPDATKRFKAFGTGCFGDDGRTQVRFGGAHS